MPCNAPPAGRSLAARALAPWLACALLFTGCAAPVGVKEVSARESYRAAHVSPLNSDRLSYHAEYVLNRYGALRQFGKRPAEVIALLHEKSRTEDRRDILYALAEMSYLQGGRLAASANEQEQALAPGYFLLSAVYAYYFVSDERPDPPPTRFDPRSRNALDLYSLGLWQGLATRGGSLELGGGVRRLPFGDLALALDTSRLPWPVADFERFLPADRFEVHGVSVMGRIQGIGLPIIGIRKGSGQTPFQALPLTAVLSLRGDYAAFQSGAAAADLALYSTLDTASAPLNGAEVPLETDFTTPLVYRLKGAELWHSGIKVFFGKEAGIPRGLYLREAHRPGRVPVVFVHGTASSPVWWTEMFNTLSFDPLIRRRCEFWYFAYASGQPVITSAADLRDALRAKVAELDPGGGDPALQQMVVIGHSQGGLLTKLTAVHTGDRLLRALTTEDLDQMKLSPATRAELRRTMLVEPLPFVKSVIFLSTPHRGSFRSKGWNRNLVRSLVQLPSAMLQYSVEYFDYLNDDVKKALGRKGSGIMTSADGQSPENPLLHALAAIPLAPGVAGHSIIGVKDDGDPESGDDGVVKYTSAHLDGMASEFIVRSNHSTQLNPLAIDEVRRILVEHLAGVPLVDPGS